MAFHSLAGRRENRTACEAPISPHLAAHKSISAAGCEITPTGTNSQIAFPII